MPPPPRLPPGQSLTRKFPVVGEKAPAVVEGVAPVFSLRVDGAVETVRALDHADWLGLPRRDLLADIHCVTGWSRFDVRFAGLPLGELCEHLGLRPLAGARFVRFESASPRRHDTSLPLASALVDTWVVDRVDGAPLPIEHGGPLRTVTPSRYFYKSLKWLARIEFLTEDRLGYWERESSYHNAGDPWAGDQRFTSGSIDPEGLRRFLQASDFGPWRSARRVLLGLDLRGFRPATRDLRGLQLKNCDLRGAELSNRDLREVNLSLSNLRQALCAGADFTGADLEGADFSGADLRDANLEGTALSATRFFGPGDDGQPLRARVEGMRWAGAHGLLEDQEAFLIEQAGRG